MKLNFIKFIKLIRYYTKTILIHRKLKNRAFIATLITIINVLNKNVVNIV